MNDANSPTQDGNVARPSSRDAEVGTVHVLLGGTKTRVVLSGDIDAELAPDLVEAATEVADARRPVEVDTQHVTFMDSTGVAFLARLAGGASTRPVVISPPEEVRFLLEITRIGDLVDIAEDDPGRDDSLPPGTGVA